MIIDAPSPRQNAQSTETHQLQQTLRGGASEQVRMYSPTQDSGDSASVFSTPSANNTPTIVKTMHEGGLEDSLDKVNLSDDVWVDLHNNTGSGYDSGLRGLVVNTDDPGEANFVMSVGALGNASGTPLDGSQDMSFGESTVSEEFTVDGDEDVTLIMAAYNVPTTYNQNDPNGVNSTIMDPEMIGALMS